MAPPANPLRNLRYLEAMGIRVWWLRRGGHSPGPKRKDADRASLERDGAFERAAEDTPGPGAGAPLAATGMPEAMPCSDAGLADDLPSLGHAQRPVRVPEPPGPGLAADPASMDWPALCRAVESCRACGLCETRTQTVFGVGDTDADLMIIGEAPGADEDRQGEPFVGRAGQLLNLMLTAIGLDRSQVYIANILKCRPPGNRDPRPAESSACRAFLMRQIELVAPRVILSVGRVSAQNLLETEEAVGRLRGRWFELGPRSLPTTVTYHPSYLLRSPEQKAKAWQDLQQVARRLRHG
jgi:DNA polymerase